jgi:hypothetical protein
MGNIRTLDMEFLDELFEMSGGFVLKFSDRTFREFFAEELNINIDDPIYSTQGTSKAKRLRYFLQTVDKSMAVRTLSALWEYREAKRLRNKEHDHVADAQERLLAIISKLQGNTPRMSTDLKLEIHFGFVANKSMAVFNSPTAPTFSKRDGATNNVMHQTCGRFTENLRRERLGLGGFTLVTVDSRRMVWQLSAERRSSYVWTVSTCTKC